MTESDSKAGLLVTAAYPGAGEPQFREGPAIAPGGKPASNAHRATGPPTHEGVLAGYISRDDLARELGVSPRTITRWTFHPGGIPHLAIGNRTLYRRESVTAWLAARETRPERIRRTGDRHRRGRAERNLSAVFKETSHGAEKAKSNQ
jgi:excisionase family DNA binding protein